LLNGNEVKYPCSRTCSLFGDCVVAFEKYLKKPLTNFDRIKAMSVEELADVIYRANDDICFSNCQKGTGDKFCCPYGDEITNEQCIGCVKKWLESEVTE